MAQRQPTVMNSRGTRSFSCSAAAILVFLVNDQREILLLEHPRRQGSWEVINGALEAEETIIAAAMRELREEAGPAVQARPLGTVHAYTFCYDEDIPHMLSICYLLAYEGGAIQPGDDMSGSGYRWWSLKELEEQHLPILVPYQQPWLLRRAIELYALWDDQQVELQPPDADESWRSTKYPASTDSTD